MPLDSPATATARIPYWADEPPVPPEGSLVPGSRFAEEQWVMAAGMLARGASFLYVARTMGCSRTTLWRAYYGAPALRTRVWWERQALNRESELRLASLRDLVAQQVERLVSLGDPATVRWAADRLGLFGAPGASLPPSPVPATAHPAEAAAPPPEPPPPEPLPSDPLSSDSLLPPIDGDDAIPGAFREFPAPDPDTVAAILARPEAEGPKGVYPWTLNPQDAYPSLGSAEERRGKGVYGLRGRGPG